MNDGNWFLLTDRKLKDWKLYGPFPTQSHALLVATSLHDRGFIRSGEWSVIQPQPAPQFRDGQLVMVAEI